MANRLYSVPRRSIRRDAWHASRRCNTTTTICRARWWPMARHATCSLAPSGALLPSLGRSDARRIATSAWRYCKRRYACCAPDARTRADAIAAMDDDELVQVTEHVWRATTVQSINWFVTVESGKVLALDYGYHNCAWHARRLNYSKPYRRRALMHSLQALSERMGIERIDVALISHFHDDHVAACRCCSGCIGTQCWASEAFADLLEHLTRTASPATGRSRYGWTGVCRSISRCSGRNIPSISRR